MRKVVLLMLLLVIIAGHAISDVIYFDDGGSHIIDNSLYQDDNISLDYNIANSPGTSLQFIDDGIVKEINAFNYSTVEVNGGTIGIDSLALGPWGRGRLASFGDSFVTVNGGVLYGDLVAYDNGTIYLYGSDFNIGGADLNYGESLRDFGIIGRVLGNKCVNWNHNRPTS